MILRTEVFTFCRTRLNENIIRKENFFQAQFLSYVVNFLSFFLLILYIEERLETGEKSPQLVDIFGTDILHEYMRGVAMKFQE
jgi:hypothetical protein